MENKTLFPQKYRLLSGSSLKLIAVLSMLIDHTASVFSKRFDFLVFAVGKHSLTLYEIMRYIGRIAFPIFAFLIVEGYLHSSDRKKYGLSLFWLAIISEIPWNLEHTGKIFCSSQNVVFTLLLGYLGIVVIDQFKGKKQALWLIGLLIFSVLFKADYGCSGFGFILLIYVLRDQKLVQMVVGSCVLSSRWIAGLAFIPINMYNGKRGFIHGKVLKYFFYSIYPLHMLVLYFLKLKLIGY